MFVFAKSFQPKAMMVFFLFSLLQTAMSQGVERVIILNPAPDSGYKKGQVVLQRKLPGGLGIILTPPKKPAKKKVKTIPRSRSQSDRRNYNDEESTPKKKYKSPIKKFTGMRKVSLPSTRDLSKCNVDLGELNIEDGSFVANCGVEEETKISSTEKIALITIKISLEESEKKKWYDPVVYIDVPDQTEELGDYLQSFHKLLSKSGHALLIDDEFDFEKLGEDGREMAKSIHKNAKYFRKRNASYLKKNDEKKWQVAMGSFWIDSSIIEKEN